MRVRPRGCDGAKVISVIQTTSLRGSGDSFDDACRHVYQYWSLDGKLLAEHDTLHDGVDTEEKRQKEAMR